MQLGLARHGSSFAFKEEVLRDRAGAGRPTPTNPVLPPPCFRPQAPCEREGGLSHHHHHHHHLHGAAACHPHGKHAGGGVGFPGNAAFPAASVTPGSLVAPGVGGLGGGDGRHRQRRRRGQRGRRGAGGNGDGNGGEGSGNGNGNGNNALGVAGPPSAYGERLAAPTGRREPPGSVFHLPDHLASVPGPDLEPCFGFGGGLSNGHLYCPVNGSAQTLGGGSDRSSGSRSSSSTYSSSSRRGSNSSWDVGCGSPALTPETLSTTPPLEMSQLEGYYSPTSALPFFLGGGGGGGGDAAGLTQHDSRPSPVFFGAAHTGTRRVSLAQQQQQQQQQQQHREGGGDERTAIAALQQQVQNLQQYLENCASGGLALSDGGGGGGGACLTPPGLGVADRGGPPDSSGGSYFDELSFVGDRLSALSWGSDDDGTAAVGVDATTSLSRHLSGGAPAVVATREPGSYHLAEGGRDDAPVSAVVPSVLTGFGSLALASAASQAEVRTGLRGYSTGI